MRQGLLSTGPYRYPQLDRDAASVRNVAGAGRAGYGAVDAGAGRRQRRVGLNNKQSVNREEYRHLDNQVTCILQQRWQQKKLGKQQAMALPAATGEPNLF